MRFLLVLLMMLSTSVFANTEIKTQIHDIDLGSANELPLIFLTSGHVVTYPAAKKLDLDKLQSGALSKKWYVFTINGERQIVKFREIAAPPSFKKDHVKAFTSDALFVPSILKNMEQAREFFADARKDAKKESQCYNRAHVWSYEWRIKKNLYSSKAWVFFTRKFIRKHKFEWWFHVAPMIHVVNNGEVKERVMDIKYASRPLKLKQWTDIFMRDQVDCPVVEKYSDQADYPESGSCFIMKSSMYYYQPVDLEELELSETKRSRWFEPEVRHAYLEAFDVTL